MAWYGAGCAACGEGVMVSGDGWCSQDPGSNTFTQHSQHREPWRHSDFCLEKSEIVSLLFVDCIATQSNQLYTAILYFFEEKSGLLRRGEM